MGLYLHTYQFTLGDVPVRAEARIAKSSKSITYRLIRDKELAGEVTVDVTPSQYFAAREVSFAVPEGVLTLVWGAKGAWTFGLIACRDGEEVFRSHEEPHKIPPRWQKVMEGLENANANADTEEGRKTSKQLQDLQPSIVVDIGLAVVFFFVAREFGLVTAAVSGAVVTILLFPIQRLVNLNLLGGFAVFGVVMALISAGLALAFQDDLFIKLRGSIMGMITATLFLTDGLLGGKYLGKRIALYMSGLFSLSPKRAGIAMGVAGIVLMGVDLPLVFLLTTDQWIWYNAFLDTFVAIPIVMTAMYYARERRPRRVEKHTGDKPVEKALD